MAKFQYFLKWAINLASQFFNNWFFNSS